MTQASTDRKFENHARTQEEEDAYDYVKHREGILPTSLKVYLESHRLPPQPILRTRLPDYPSMLWRWSLYSVFLTLNIIIILFSSFGSAGHLIKSALGSGILGGPLAYSKAGAGVAVILNILAGLYMGFCFYFLVESNKILLRRTQKPFMSYADTAEAAVMLFPKHGVRKYSSCFRYVIDIFICMGLFGGCCTYQLIVAKSLKQLVEDTLETALDAPPGYPTLRMYLIMLLPIYVCICLIRQLKFLAPFSLGANLVIAMCILMATYYCFQNNSGFKDLKIATDFSGTLKFLGMSVFSMSCIGLIIPVEGSMRHPENYPCVLAVGIFFIIFSTVTISFFGYAAYPKNPQAPFTINFPMETLPKVFKCAIIVMLIVTHAINFWGPFDLCWFYMKQRIKTNRFNINTWERILRATFVIVICMFGVVFPTISGLMGFIGSFSIACTAFIWPNIIVILVYYERPGMGRFHWRLIRSIIFISIGFFIFICGSLASLDEFMAVFSAKDAN